MKKYAAATRVERNLAIQIVEASLQERGAYLEDFHLFSNVAASFLFDEMPTDRLEDWIAKLGEQSISVRELPEAAPGSTGPTEARTRGSLHLTLLHDEPDMRRVVPKVPG